MKKNKDNFTLSKEDFIIESKIAHDCKFDYSNIDYIDLKNKIELKCNEHGYFNVSAYNHIFQKKECQKCFKKTKNDKRWLDYLNIPDNLESRNVIIKLKDSHILINGFDKKTDTAYLFYNDISNGNVNIYNSDDINEKFGLSYLDLYNRTQVKEELLKNNGYKVITIWESDYIKKFSKEAKLIIHDNKYAQIQLNDEKIFNRIRRAFSFKVAGFEYTSAARNGWDGINYLIDRNGMFLSGIIGRVRKALINYQFNLTVIDKRKSTSQAKEIIIDKKLKELGLEPRYYQNNILQSAIKNEKGIVRACTGSGKTLTTALITAKFNKPTIIYVIGLDLLKQFHDLYKEIFNEEIGFIGNGVCNIKRINIASIWTIGSALNIKNKDLDDDDDEKEITPTKEQSLKIIKMLSEAKIHIFDESHVITTNTIKEIFKYIDPERIYGFSGTPFRDDGSDLLIHSILGDQIINVSASELIEHGHLAQPIIKFVRTPKTYIGSGTSNYQTVYKEYICDNIIRNNLIIETANELLTKKYQVLILFKHLNHGKNLRNLLDQKNIKYEYLSGSDSLEKRTEVKENLLSKKSNLVLASSIFDIGVDISSLSSLILAGGGKSSIRALQRVGRVIRKFPGKKHVAIVDFYDDVKWLKNHSKKRFKIYSSEDGFKLIIPKNLEKDLNQKDNDD